jgi:hypothetical protein
MMPQRWRRCWAAGRARGGPITPAPAGGSAAREAGWELRVCSEHLAGVMAALLPPAHPGW